MKYIDMHCHVFPESIAAKAVENLQNYYNFPWEGSGLAADIKQRCQESGISKCLIFSSATKPEQVPAINKYISDLVRETPDLFEGLGTIHPLYPHWQKELQLLNSFKLKGIKIHPDFQHLDIDDPRMMDIYAAAGELDLLLLFHVGDKKQDHSSPRRLARVIEKYPGLKVIAAHLGGYSRWDEALDCLAGSSVYFDTSSAIAFMEKEQALRLICTHGTDKVLFASDYPAAAPATALRQLETLGLPREDMEKICYRNAAKLLYGIPLA